MQMQVVELSRTHDAWLSILCFNREVKRPSSAVIVTTDHELRVKICGETRKRCESTSLGLEKTSHRTLLYNNHIGGVATPVLHTTFQIPLKYRKKWSFLPKDKSPGHFWNEKEREREKGLGWRRKGEPQAARLTPPTNSWGTLIPSRKLEAVACMTFQGSGTSKTGKRVLQPLPSAVPAHSLLHALSPLVSTAQCKICHLC